MKVENRFKRLNCVFEDSFHDFQTNFKTSLLKTDLKGLKSIFRELFQDFLLDFDSLKVED